MSEHREPPPSNNETSILSEYSKFSQRLEGIDEVTRIFLGNISIRSGQLFKPREVLEKVRKIDLAKITELPNTHVFDDLSGQFHHLFDEAVQKAEEQNVSLSPSDIITGYAEFHNDVENQGLTELAKELRSYPAFIRYLKEMDVRLTQSTPQL